MRTVFHLSWDTTDQHGDGTEYSTSWLAGQLRFFFVFLFWLRWVFVAAHGLSLVVASRGYSSLWCTGFSLRWLLLLRSVGFRRVVVARWL